MLLLDKFRNPNTQVIANMANMVKQIFQTLGNQQTQLVHQDIAIQIRPGRVDIQQIQRILIQENQECPEVSLRVKAQRVEEERVQAMRDQRIDSNIK